MILKVFTDGACINNGKYNAKGGFGVYFPKYPEKKWKNPKNPKFIKYPKTPNKSQKSRNI